MTKLNLNEIAEEYTDFVEFIIDYAQFVSGDEVMWEDENGKEWFGVVKNIKYNPHHDGFFTYETIIEGRLGVSIFLDGELEAV